MGKKEKTGIRCSEYFTDLWAFHSGRGLEVDEDWVMEIEGYEPSFDSEDSQVEDLWTYFLRYRPPLFEDLKSADRFVYLFYFFAFRNGYFSTIDEDYYWYHVLPTMFQRVLWHFETVTQRVLNTEVFPVLVVYLTWLRVGMIRAWFDELPIDKRVLSKTRAMTLDEFKKGTPYKNITPKHFPIRPMCVVISHRWESPHKPDPKKMQKKAALSVLSRGQNLLSFLLQPVKNKDILTTAVRQCITMPPQILLKDPNSRDMVQPWMNLLGSGGHDWAALTLASRMRNILVWYDYFSVPQDANADVRLRCKEEVGPLCRYMPVLVVPSPDYFARGWCVYECIQSQANEGPSWHRYYKVTHGVGHAGHEFVLDRYVESLYGRVCRILENYRVQNETKFMPLPKMNLRCALETDLLYLSSQLEDFSERGGHWKLFEGYVHPFFTAIWKFLDKMVANGPDGLETARNCSAIAKFMFEEKSRMEDKFYGEMEMSEPLQRITFHYCHPLKAVGYLVETFVEWDDMPNLVPDAERLCVLLISLNRASQGCPPDVELEEFNDECDKLVAMIRGLCEEMKAQKVEIEWKRRQCCCPTAE